MNKVQVGCAPSPNLKTVSSKIGSMANASYKPGGGNVKIETQKVKIEAKSKVGARNDSYVKSGGDKKVFVLSTPSVGQIIILIMKRWNPSSNDSASFLFVADWNGKTAVECQVQNWVDEQRNLQTWWRWQEDRKPQTWL